MKKLVFMFATIVAISFASCGGQTTNEVAADSTATDTVDTVLVDTVVADSVITAE
jgi:hypothetical protein